MRLTCISISTALLLITQSLLAQGNRTYQLSGNIGPYAVHMSLSFRSDNSVSGSYYYDSQRRKGNTTDILLDGNYVGSIENGHIYLREYITQGGKEIGFFSCQLLRRNGYLTIDGDAGYKNHKSGIEYRVALSSQTVFTSNSSISGKRKLSGQEVFQKCSPAVFMILTSTGSQGFQGSGFFISSDGLAVSNYHVFEGTGKGLEIIKLSNGLQLKVDRVELIDKENDVILFKVRLPSGTKSAYIPISTQPPQIGDRVFAIGSPLGLENTFSSGEVSQLRGRNTIQINAPIDHGSSGGALINEYGEAIGITVGGMESSANLNFAIDIRVLKRNTY